jgi:hypothetical protein
MNSKKLITLLVLTTLLLGLVPVMTVNAVTITGTYEEDGTTAKTDGNEGETVAVIGSDVTAGKNVELYWDLVQPWSSLDGAGLVNSSKAESSGDFEVWFDIPEATVGTHWLWVRDTETGETDKVAFTVNSYVDPSADSGLEGDKVDVDLFGFEDEIDVALALVDDLVGATSTDDLGDTAYGILEYEFTLADTLILPGSVTLNDGVVWTDNGDGTLTSSDGSGTINYLTGDVELEYDSNPGVRDVLATPAYTYFENTVDDTYVFTTGVQTNDFGTAFKRCTIPDEAEMGYGNYLFLAWDEDGNVDTEDFAIGAVITLDVDEGPVGTVVEIRGSGFEDTETIINGEVTITDGATPVTCYIIDVDTGIEIDNSGDFKLEVVIPNVDMDDYDKITVVDGAGNTASADFEVTGEASFEVDPEYGVQGTRITIHGYNFTQIDDEEVVLKLYSEAGAELLDIETFETDNDGEFEGTFTVPARTSDPYILTCNQTDWDVSAETSFRIGMMIVILSPNNGPSGTLVTITGTGFSEDDEWNATFGDLDLVEDGDVDDEGNLGVAEIPTFYVPTVDPGVYTLTVLDITEIDVEVEFTVTDKTMVEFDPPNAPQDYNVSIMGNYFAADDDDLSDVNLEFVIWNETDDWDMDVYTCNNNFNPREDTIVDDEGNFTGWWDFNDGDIELDTGTYWVNITDDEDLFTQVMFNVVTKTTEIDPRKATFRIGDTVGFKVESSFAQDDSYIKIWDPDGELYWTTDDFIEDLWQKVGTIQIVPFYEQTAGGNPMVLLDDAPIGTWEWTWYDEDDDEIDSGVFNVEAAAEDVLGEQVQDLNEAMADLTDDIATVSDAVAGVKSDVNSAIAAANAAVEAANSAVEAVNSVAGTASQAAEAAQNAADAAESAQNAASGLTTLVYGAIGASLVAALAAIVSLMQISRRIAG